MSCFHQNPEKTIITIENYENVDNIEYFKVSVKCWQEKEWTVSRRYRDFRELHEKLQKETAIVSIDLPGKKVIKSKEFLEKRRKYLEKYLQAVAVSCRHSMPLDFVEFLDLDKYDIVFLLQKLASQLSQRINTSTRLKRKFTVLEVN